MRRMAGSLVLLALLLPLGLSVRAAPETAGKSAVLMEVSTGTVICQKNAHEALAPASVTKIMTMLLIMEALEDGRIALTDTVTASDNASSKGGSQIYLRAGETMTVEELLKSIAVSSANDAACAMAEHLAGSEGAFVERMNEKARELGMEDTRFVNCTGLDDSPEAEHHRTSAWDIALMSRELLKNHPKIKEFTTIWMDTVRQGTFGLSNTNKLVRFYQGATGLKTGFTSGAGYCLSASAQRDGMELIAVVMGADTSQSRNDSCKALLDYGFAGYALVMPRLPEPAAVPVRLGSAKTVSLVPDSGGGILVDKALRGSVRLETVLEEEVSAPVARGQTLGTMTVMAGDRELASIPLVAAQDIPRLTFPQIVTQILRRTAMSAPGDGR